MKRKKILFLCDGSHLTFPRDGQIPEQTMAESGEEGLCHYLHASLNMRRAPRTFGGVARECLLQEEEDVDIEKRDLLGEIQQIFDTEVVIVFSITNLLIAPSGWKQSLHLDLSWKTLCCVC
ncbi:hypothetical protein GN958_ATG00887 [Phytophthora infestans]|uniref:Uncharacterized protein n=1 Tax=Phytophthora infestans TaxID=4787 RepID=A0A8S9VH02_PHYIN|nr:hypothetical protein GN958_ATG00887 [Phytophthora infestans]